MVYYVGGVAYENGRPVNNPSQLNLGDLQRLGLADNRYAASTAESMRQMEEQGAALRESIDAGLAQFLPQESGNDDGGGGGGITYDPDAFAKAQAAEQERRRTINAVETLRGLMNEYGLASLMGKIEEYVKQGYEADAVIALIRTTPEYKERFPAMEALSKKQRAISEAAYIEFERNAAQLERAFGLPAGMLGKDTVTNLLTNEVSANELEQRVSMAAAGAYQAPAELREVFSQYYGIDSGGLTAYFLDPDKALPLLNKQYASAQIGTEAQMQDFNIAVGMAERLAEAGVSQAQAREGFGQISRQRGFTQGRGDVVSQEQLVSGTLLQDQQAQQAIERAQKARKGRFEGGGGFTATQQGVAGLGTAATR